MRFDGVRGPCVDAKGVVDGIDSKLRSRAGARSQRSKRAARLDLHFLDSLLQRFGV